MKKALIAAALSFILWQSDTASIKCHAEGQGCDYGAMPRLMSGYVYHSRHPDMASCEGAKEQLLRTLDETNDGRQEYAIGQQAMGRGDGTYERLLYAEPLCRVTGEDPNPVPQSRKLPPHFESTPPQDFRLPARGEAPVPVPGDVPKQPK